MTSQQSTAPGLATLTGTPVVPGVAYAPVMWPGARPEVPPPVDLPEDDCQLIERLEPRVELLRAIEESVFFQNIRGGLVTGLYNQKAVWPLFGYEGESFSHGGYIERGFDDINWL